MFSPSAVPEREKYVANIAVLERLGFRVKLSANFYKDTYGYTASAEERADDLNALVADDNVGMVLFSGGEGAAEILPLIDYESIRRHPKIFSSYSDGTSILNAIHAQTDVVTYYGISPGIFSDLRHYNYMQFCSHFVEGYEAKEFVSDCEWRTLRGGTCSGTMIGGYTSQFAQMQMNPYFKYDENRKYLLFLEDHEHFSEVGAVASYLAFIGQSKFMRNVVGLIFGHYSVNVPETLLRCLERFGDAHGIPVVYTDDFGHGTRHAVFPIGIDATLDADAQRLIFH
jgi:muramoyltetrapeptide carboxypeptidase